MPIFDFIGEVFFEHLFHFANLMQEQDISTRPLVQLYRMGDIFEVIFLIIHCNERKTSQNFKLSFKSHSQKVVK